MAASENETGGQGPPRYAVLAPHAARWILRRLKDSGVNGGAVRTDAAFRRTAGHPRFAAELESGWRQIVAAASSAQTSEGGSAEASPAEAVAELGHEVTTGQAGAALGCTSRRVRQLLDTGMLTGRKAGATWLVDAASLEQLRDLRRSAA